MIRIRHHALLLFVLCIIAGLSLMAGLAWGFVEVVRLCRRGSPWGFVWIGLLLAAVIALWLWRKLSRRRAYQELLVRGVDCGLTEESMRAVDALLQEGGKLCRRKPSQALVLAPGIREFANRYSSVRCRGVSLFANRLTEGAFSPKGDSDWYYVIGCEDEESLYCVKKSAADEEGAKTLNELSGLIDTSRQKEVAFKMVVTATGDSAYQRADGIIVCPLGALRP